MSHIAHERKALQLEAMAPGYRDATSVQYLQNRQSHLDSQRRSVETFYSANMQELGSVLAGSGFRRRTTENARLDWALVRVNNKSRLPEKNKVSIVLLLAALLPWFSSPKIDPY